MKTILSNLFCDSVFQDIINSTEKILSLEIMVNYGKAQECGVRTLALQETNLR